MQLGVLDGDYLLVFNLVELVLLVSAAPQEYAPDSRKSLCISVSAISTGAAGLRLPRWGAWKG